MPPESPPVRGDQLRELLGLLLLVVGFVGLVIPAFFTDPRLGFAVVGAFALVGGYKLTVREV